MNKEAKIEIIGHYKYRDGIYIRVIAYDREYLIKEVSMIAFEQDFKESHKIHFEAHWHEQCDDQNPMSDWRDHVDEK